MGLLVNFPLLVVPLVVYNLFALGGGSAPGVLFDWQQPIIGMTMASGIPWTMTLGDMLITASLFLLFLEVLKSTRTGASSIIDHMLSVAVLIAFVVEFLLVPQAATSTFFIIGCMALFDVVAGFSVTISAARRDVGIGPSSQL